MKNPRLISQCRSKQRGVALIIVLAMLVLLSGIIVAFMTSATTERAASSANAGVTNARQIADSTVSFVISQIRDATSAPNDTSSSLYEKTTWASQPGAIRTFAGTLNQGVRKTGLPDSPKLPGGAYWDDYTPDDSDAVYKLYSADRLKVSSKEYAGSDLAKDNEAVNNWDALDASKNAKSYPEYVDLNEPILSTRFDLASDGTVVEPRYPIIDPRAKLDKAGAPLNPSANPGIVDGFDANFTTHKTLKLAGIDGKKTNNGVPLLPLPVKWLYLFRDGTMGPASLGTVKNPIVGRTAFWTDDETCKLNINTASEGTFWDTPSVSSMQEMGNWATTGTAIPATDRGLNLATSQPVKGEFQRYPGHPATTCLSPALGWLWDISNAPAFGATPVGPYAGGGINLPYSKFKQAIYRMSPYTPYGLGTSQDGTHNSDAEADVDGKLRVSTKHLYASVDELIFRSGRFAGGGTNATPDINAIDPATPISPEALERVRFFLTASSRAPELNLFSRPRVTIWPVNALTKYRTSFDDVFIFTSTLAKGVGGADSRYCFLRGDAKSPTADFAGIDGRNGQLFTFLQTMTSKAIPGFGGKFDSTTKWGPAERDEILTLIMDYFRTVNMVDTGTTTRTGDVFAPYTPKFFYGTPPANQYQRYERSYDWSGQVTPLRKNATDKYQGLGRFITPTEVAIVFTGNAPAPPNPPAGAKYMRATMLIEMTTAMAGYPGIRETYWTKVIPVRKTSIQLAGAVGAVDINLCGDKSLTVLPRKDLINICNIGSHEVAQGRSFMPTLGFAAAMFRFPEHKGHTLLNANSLEDPRTDTNRVKDYTVFPKKLDNSQSVSLTYSRGDTNTVLYYPYVSDPINYGTASTFALNAGAYDIEIWVGETPSDPRSMKVQTVHIDFPPAAVLNLRVPTSNDMAARIATSTDGFVENPAQFINGADTVRSMELTCGQTDNRAGDVRLAAARADVPKEFFAPRDGLTEYTKATPILHGMTRGHGDPEPSYTGNGLFVTGGAIRGSKPPILPKFVQGVERSDAGKPPGDWDRGLSKHMDGAMGNKVDEGNIKYDYSSGATDHTVKPYYRGRGIEETGQSFFTPNRQLPSAVMLGSLPTGVVRNQPWQTLLFRPNREVGSTHPGADTRLGPPDHLMLDLLHMPVVEPYAISEPFSTAGKVNMNYVLAPFGYTSGPKNTGFSGTNPDTANPRSYVRRDTALRGVLKSVYMMAVPNGTAEGAHNENIESVTTPFRYPIDPSRTLEQFETRLKFKTGEYPLFRSASEICTVDLYPRKLSQADALVVGTGDTGWSDFWKANALTGDNMRERPYAHIFPRLTTKSNVYTVHMRCQAIRKSPNSKPDEYNSKLDSVVGDYRGSATIERFVDPNDIELAKYKENTQKVDPLYRYRVVNTKHFAPK